MAAVLAELAAAVADPAALSRALSAATLALLEAAALDAAAVSEADALLSLVAAAEACP